MKTARYKYNADVSGRNFRLTRDLINKHFVKPLQKHLASTRDVNLPQSKFKLEAIVSRYTTLANMDDNKVQDIFRVEWSIVHIESLDIICRVAHFTYKLMNFDTHHVTQWCAQKIDMTLRVLRHHPHIEFQPP